MCRLENQHICWLGVFRPLHTTACLSHFPENCFVKFCTYKGRSLGNIELCSVLPLTPFLPLGGTVSVRSHISCGAHTKKKKKKIHFQSREDWKEAAGGEKKGPSCVSDCMEVILAKNNSIMGAGRGKANSSYFKKTAGPTQIEENEGIKEQDEEALVFLRKQLIHISDSGSGRLGPLLCEPCAWVRNEQIGFPFIASDLVFLIKRSQLWLAINLVLFTLSYLKMHSIVMIKEASIKSAQPTAAFVWKCRGFCRLIYCALFCFLKVSLLFPICHRGQMPGPCLKYGAWQPCSCASFFFLVAQDCHLGE